MFYFKQQKLEVKQLINDMNIYFLSPWNFVSMNNTLNFVLFNFISINFIFHPQKEIVLQHLINKLDYIEMQNYWLSLKIFLLNSLPFFFFFGESLNLLP